MKYLFFRIVFFSLIVSTFSVLPGSAKSMIEPFPGNKTEWKGFVKFYTELPDELFDSDSYHNHWNGIRNSFLKFQRERKGRVAFLGGSITYNEGWRESICFSLQKRLLGADIDKNILATVDAIWEIRDKSTNQFQPEFTTVENDKNYIRQCMKLLLCLMKYGGLKKAHKFKLPYALHI